MDEPDTGRPPSDAPVGAEEELRRTTRTSVLAHGTLACPRCDAPVAPAGSVSPADALACPFCLHSGHVRDFLSLGEPTRPTRVVVRVTPRHRIRVARAH